MRLHFSSLVMVSSCLVLTSCATRQTRQSQRKQVAAQSQKKTEQPIAKAGHKVPELSSGREAATGDLNSLFERLNEPTMQLMDEDVRKASGLHPAAKGSLEEAVLILTQLRLFRIQLEQNQRFQTRDLYEGQREQPIEQTSAQSLERLFQDLNIDLASAFQNNSQLQTEKSLKLARELLERTKNSVAFDTNLHAVLDEESKKWAAKNPSAQATEATVATPAALPPADAVPASPNSDLPAPVPSRDTNNNLHQAPIGEVKTAATDLKRSDAILMQAQKLADKGDFKQAIESAASIDTQDPFYEQAREKIRIYSNRAVQDLRQKAAQAFQNALPMSDSAAKQAYLVQAKAFLEKALQEYPSADQLDTVKENLAVITRDLDSITNDTAVDSTAKSQ